MLLPNLGGRGARIRSGAQGLLNVGSAGLTTNGSGTTAYTQTVIAAQDLLIVGLVGQATTDYAVGAAGAEVAFASINWNTATPSVLALVAPVFVPAGTRLSVRVSGAATTNYIAQMYAVPLANVEGY